MIAAIHHGGAPPLWVVVLMAAREWGCPPWEIAEGGSRLLWFNRWSYWTGQLHKAQSQGDDG